MERKISFKRKTSETAVEGAIDLDGKGKARISTGIGFLNHMLELFAFHSGFDLEVKCKGDLDICAHHSIEDIALTIGQAFYDVLGERKGIKRYSTCYLPMDETLTRTVIDISGRPYHVFRGSFEHSSIGLLPTEMVKHFFYSFCMTGKITLHQEIFYGENDHHKAESLFKGFARSLADAVIIASERIPSSKGIL